MSPQLQIALVSALSAVGGSLVGGIISYLTNKNLNRQKWELEQIERLASSREQLYSEFLAEAGARAITAIDRKSLDAADFAQLFSLLSRIRLVASAPVVDAAECLAKKVTAAHLAEPATKDKPDKRPMTESFIIVSRQELEQLRGKILI